MTEEREQHLVLADQLIQQGDPRGELAVIHDRILQGDAALLPQARAIIEANLSDWLGFAALVKNVHIDEVDGDLFIQLDEFRLLTIRWGFIIGWCELRRRDDRLASSWDRPAVRVRRFGLTGLREGELEQFLGSRDSSRITGVMLSKCAIGANDLDAIAALPELCSFGAYDCEGLDDWAVRYIGGRGLRELALTRGEVHPALLRRLPLEALEVLVFLDPFMPFEARDLLPLFHATKLRSLTLSPLTGIHESALPLELPSLVSLELIDLEAIGTTMLRRLAKNPLLTRFSASAINGASQLRQIDSHESVRLEPNTFSTELLEALCGLSFVRGIDMRSLPQLRDADLACLAQLPDLRALAIVDCPNVEGSFLKRLDRLRYLRLDHSGSITDRSLPLSSIEHLSLFGCTGVNGAFLDGLPLLKSLDLGRVELDDDAFALLLRQRDLRSLDLSETTLSNARLRSIVDAMPKLRRLSLRLSRGITSSGFLPLLELEHLKRIEVTGTTFRHADRFEGVAAFPPRHELMLVPPDLFD